MRDHPTQALTLKNFCIEVDEKMVVRNLNMSIAGGETAFVVGDSDICTTAILKAFCSIPPSAPVTPGTIYLSKSPLESENSPNSGFPEKVFLHDSGENVKDPLLQLRWRWVDLLKISWKQHAFGNVFDSFCDGVNLPPASKASDDIWSPSLQSIVNITWAIGQRPMLVAWNNPFGNVNSEWNVQAFKECVNFCSDLGIALLVGSGESFIEHDQSNVYRISKGELSCEG